jgi:hypothetical protein
MLRAPSLHALGNRYRRTPRRHRRPGVNTLSEHLHSELPIPSEGLRPPLSLPSLQGCAELCKKRELREAVESAWWMQTGVT